MIHYKIDKYTIGGALQYYTHKIFEEAGLQYREDEIKDGDVFAFAYLEVNLRHYESDNYKVEEFDFIAID